MRYMIGFFIGGIAAAVSPAGRDFFAETWIHVRTVLAKVWPVVQSQIDSLLS